MAREELVQKAKEVREAILELARDYVDATHIEVGQIKAKDDTRKLLTIRVADANRYVPYAGHDTSEFTVGDYWAVMFDDLGSVRLAWWVSNNAGAGTIPFRAHDLLDGDAHPDTVAQAVTRGSVIIGDSTPEWNELPIGAAGRVLSSDGADVSWALPGGVAAHNILDGVVHLDSVIDAVTRGSLIYGNSTPKWDELVIGVAARYLRSDGADPAWGQIPGSEVVNTPAGGIAATDVQAAIDELDTEKVGTHDILDGAVHPDSAADAVTRGSIIIGNATPKWDELPIGAAGRVLTVVAGDVAWAVPAGGNGAEAIFGSCYGNHIAWVQAAAVQNTWYNVSDADIADGELDGVTHDGDGKLTVPDSGEYLVLYACCYLDNIANNHVEVGIEIDGSGAAEAAGRTHSETKFANQEEHLGGCVILDLTAGETVELAIRTIDVGAPNITIDGMNLAVYFLAGGADGATAIKWAVLL